MTVRDSSKVTIIKSDSLRESLHGASARARDGARESVAPRRRRREIARERWRRRRRCCSIAAVSVEEEADDDGYDVGERDGTTMMGEFAHRHHCCWYRYYWFRCASWRQCRRRRLVRRRISGTGSPVRCRHQSRRRRRRLCDGRTPRC